jgi:hypothetical protein
MKMRHGTMALGLVAASLTAALPAAAASTGKGSHPNSALCKTYVAETKVAEKGAGALEKDMESGHYGKYKSALLASYRQGVKAEQVVQNALHGAPANVQKAATTSLAFAGTEKKIIEASTSLASLQKAFEKAAAAPKLAAAEKVLSSYITAQCGNLSPTT